MNAALFLATGFEEIEALATVDILRRGGVEVTTVSVTGEKTVDGAHGITVVSDCLFNEIGEYDMLILPGGAGFKALLKHEKLLELIKKYHGENKYLAAICAAPTILGSLGILKDKTAVCYPGMENALNALTVGSGAVEQDGKIITSKAAGTTFEFALRLLENLTSAENAERVRESICVL